MAGCVVVGACLCDAYSPLFFPSPRCTTSDFFPFSFWSRGAGADRLELVAIRIAWQGADNLFNPACGNCLYDRWYIRERLI